MYEFKRSEYLYYYHQSVRDCVGCLFGEVYRRMWDIEEFIPKFFATEEGRRLSDYDFRTMFDPANEIIRRSGVVLDRRSTVIDLDPIWLGWYFADVHMYLGIPYEDIQGLYLNDLGKCWYYGHQEDFVWWIRKVCEVKFGEIPDILDFDKHPIVPPVYEKKFDFSNEKEYGWDDFLPK